jgi:MoxR-like ATPase
MAMDAKTAKLVSDVEGILGSSESVDIDINDSQISGIIDDIHKAKVRLELTYKDIKIDFPQGGSTTLRISRITAQQKANADASATSKPPEKKAKSPTSTPTLKRHQHSYVVPKIAKDLIAIMTDEASHVVWLTGPTQCGKDRLVHHIGRELNRKVFQINCRGDMGSEIFFGDKTVEIDDASKQNKVVFVKGLVEQALTEGLDEQGNEVGQPGILFITEAASMPAHVAIGINRLLESDDARRTMVIDQDGGRVVRGHSGLRIVMAANTVGRGATGMEASAYTAQTDALDISLINRIAACFRMGYDREVERHILAEKIGDDRVAALVLKFRDAIRDLLKQGKLQSPFSTAHIVHIADMYRIFGDLGKAVYYVIFEFLMPDEKALYNETAMAVFGKDLLKEYTATGIDYM